MTLESGKNYTVTPASALLDDGDGKIYLHVKFTDSSFKTIEEFATRMKRSNQQPIIPVNFAGDHGVSLLYFFFNYKVLL